jgi:nucleotide-binding universal stress UspA family protein
MRVASMSIGMDFSNTAIEAARWAVAHFAPSVPATLVHVIPPPDQPAFAGHVLPPSAEIEAVAREYAETQMRRVAGLLAPAVVTTDIRVGKPYEEITASAGATGAGLVVVGPHSDRPRPRKFLGTTAERVVRTSPVPVLVATNPPPGRPRRILVPVDDSAITPVLLSWTRELATSFDADVTLLHVWSNAVYSHVASMSYAVAEREDDARRAIEKELHDTAAQWLETLARTGITRERVTARVAHGKAGEVTIETAAEMSADLIVLGRRGSGLVLPALLGSTVGTILHGATCPVFVVAPSGTSVHDG